MTVSVTPLPTPPQSTDPVNFDARADAFLAALPAFATELNAQNAENNSINQQVGTQLAAATAQAVAAGASANASATSALASAASANFKGNWSALTGALNIPASVLHNGMLWTLTANLANVTTAQPGVSSAWYPIVTLDRADRSPIQPSLDLDFANQRYRVFDGAVGLKEIALADILTYTGSGRTYCDALGILRTQSSNAPRIEFDPVTGAGLGLSVWGARTNLLTRSNEFDNSAWIKGATTVTANAATAPDGTLTANEFKEYSANAAHSITQSQTITSGTTYTYSVYAKEMPTGAKRYLSVSLSSVVFGANMRVTVDLATGSSVPLNSPLATSVQALGNGWWRISITALATATATGSNLVSLRLFNAAVDTLASYTGDGTSGIYIWGAQLEAGSAPSPYIPTTTSAVTAPSDIANITGANFSKWFNPNEGTFVVVANSDDTLAASNRLLLTAIVDSNNRIVFNLYGSAVVGAFVVSSGVTQATLIHEPKPGAGRYAISASYAPNDFSSSLKGSAALTDSSVVLPSGLTQLQIGNQSGIEQANLNIARVLYFPRALPTHLQVLSA